MTSLEAATVVSAQPARARALWEALRAARRGDCHGAAAIVHAASVAAAPEPLTWTFGATAIDLLVSAGRYRDALGLHARLAENTPPDSVSTDAQGHALAHVNGAEAHYNLGQHAQAWLCLEQAQRILGEHSLAPWVHASAGMQRAWLLALEGHSRDALAELARLAEGDVLREYRAELAFTHALACVQLRDFERAGLHAERGLRLARRPASERNACFVLGHVAHLRGALEEARTWLQRGSEHRYRGQGGASLVEHGDVLRALHGDGEDAAHAYRLAAERDPESAAVRAHVVHEPTQAYAGASRHGA